jgi:DNA repair protein RadD
MVSYKDLISRADNAWLQGWVDPAVIRVVHSLRQDAVATRVAREVFLDLVDPLEALSRPTSRGRLIELLRPGEANALAAALGQLDGDAYRSLSVGVFPPGSRSLALLCDFFGLDAPALGATTDFTPAQSRVEASYGLFDHQQVAVASLRSALADTSRRVLLHMPTGAGKTRMAMHVICAALATRSPSLVIWLANSEELCEQAAEEFVGAWRHLGNRAVNLYRLWGHRQMNFNEALDGLVIAGFPKLYSLAKRDLTAIATLGDATHLLVIDEAHQAIAPTYRLVIEGLSARRDVMPILGLTATPGRTWNDPETDKQLSDFFRRKKVTLQAEGYANPIDFLVSEGYLAQPTFAQIEHTSANLSADDLAALSNDLDVPAAVLKKLAADERRTLKIVRDVEKLVREHPRVLVFGTTVEHAVSLAAVLRASGIDSRVITSETPSRSRSAAIAWYKEPGEAPRVLTNFGVLTTGFDAPRTSAAVIARPTKSLVLYSQMVGRAIRGPRAGGNARATIVTIVDMNLPGFGSLAAAFSNWEDVW